MSNSDKKNATGGVATTNQAIEDAEVQGYSGFFGGPLVGVIGNVPSVFQGILGSINQPSPAGPRNGSASGPTRLN